MDKQQVIDFLIKFLPVIAPIILEWIKEWKPEFMDRVPWILKPVASAAIGAIIAWLTGYVGDASVAGGAAVGVGASIAYPFGKKNGWR